MEEICPGIDFETESALIDDGLLDSLDIVTLSSEIIDEFDIGLNVTELVPENFNSVESIWALIESKMK